MPDYASLRKEAVVPLPGGGTALRRPGIRPVLPGPADLRPPVRGDLSETGHNTLAGYNINTLAVQVPKSTLALKGDAKRNPVIGVWSTTDRRGADVTGAGGKGTEDAKAKEAQGSPQGPKRRRVAAGLPPRQPLVNEVVVPLKFKDAFNALSRRRTPRSPGRRQGQDPIVPELVESIYKIPAPATAQRPRRDLPHRDLQGVRPHQGGPQLAAPQPGRRQGRRRPCGNAAPEHVRPARRQASQPPRRPRQGPGRLPQRPPPQRRRRRHRTPGPPRRRADRQARARPGSRRRRRHPYREPGDTFPYVALPSTAAVSQADSLHPDGGVGAAPRRPRLRRRLPVVPVTALGGGALLAMAGVLALRRRRGVGRGMNSPLFSGRRAPLLAGASGLTYPGRHLLRLGPTVPLKRAVGGLAITFGTSLGLPRNIRTGDGARTGTRPSRPGQCAGAHRTRRGRRAREQASAAPPVRIRACPPSASTSP